MMVSSDLYKSETTILGLPWGLQSEKKFKNIDFGLSGSIFFYCTIFPVLAYYILYILEDSQRGKNHNSMNKKKDQMLWF